MRLVQEAFPLARSSMIAKHLLQRVFGTMITAARSPLEARVIVDRAESTLGWDDACAFCQIMLSVPATIACARAGDMAHARRHLEAAERSALLWQGTAWEASISEARAAVATASGDPETACRQLHSATERFRRAGQPLDAARVELAMAGC